MLLSDDGYFMKFYEMSLDAQKRAILSFGVNLEKCSKTRKYILKKTTRETPYKVISTILNCCCWHWKLCFLGKCIFDNDKLW